MIKPVCNAVLTTALMMASCWSQAAGKVALVIGNSEYKVVADRLKNPVNDAKAMAQLLKAEGYQTTLLLNAGLDSMLDNLNRVKEQVDAGGAIVFYYAGHGIQFDGQNFLVPTDARLADRERAVREAVQLKEVVYKLDESPAAAKVLIIDACRNDPFPKAYRSSSRGLAPMQDLLPTKGLMIMYAASPGEVAQDGKGVHGAFTDALLSEIRRGQIPLTELMDNVVDRVRSSTAGQQNPYYEYFRGGFPRLPLGSGRLEDKNIPPNSAAPTHDQNTELVFWQSMLGSTDIDDYQEFLSRFPDGTYASIAKRKIRNLQEQVEKEAWKNVADSRDQGALEDFLQRFPDGSHVKQVQERLAVLTKPMPAPVQEPTNKPASPVAVDTVSEQTAEILSCLQDHTCPTQTVQDCSECPELVVIPPGTYLMGSRDGEGYNDEKPQHTVEIRKNLAVGKYELTFGQWDACVAQGGCNGYKPADEGWGRDRNPVINVSWNDAQSYLAWLRGKTGKKYRLLTEAEWEYAARAGTTTAFSTGVCIKTTQANYNNAIKYNQCDVSEPLSRQKILAVGSFAANAFGLYDMLGNVREWVADCLHDNYLAAPTDGSAWDKNCSGATRRILRGGGWSDVPSGVRSANRLRNLPDSRNSMIGFRVVREL